MSGRPPEHVVDLVSRFRGHAARRPDAPAFAWFDRRCAVQTAYDNAGFLARCEGLAGALLAKGCRPGAPVLLLHPPGAAFFESFFACLLAGLVPVPAYPPDPLGRGPRLDFVTTVCVRMGIEVALTTARYDRARKLGNVRHVFGRAGGWPSVRWIATDRLAPGAAPPPRRPAAHDLAFVQFTSGSTRDPRGVRITHGNLMHNLRVNSAGGDMDPRCRMVSWLPQYHDLGLVNVFLCALYVGCPVWLCSPLDFIAEPSIWPEMMHRVRATHSGAPDFAYAYTLRRTTPAQRRRWDLSALACTVSGGEAVRPATVRAFAEAFAPSGLRRSALFGGYGQAEHVVGMVGGTVRIITVDGLALVREGALVPVAADHARAHELASSGRPFEGVELRIVDPETGAALPPGRIGEIWACSPSVSPGYVDAPAHTAAVFENRLDGDDRHWLRTGDLGALDEGDLFVTGRLKDLIIVRGRNVMPSDVEHRIRAAGLVEVRPGGVAVFGVEQDGEEVLAAAVELRDDRLEPSARAALAERIKVLIAADGLHLARLQLVRKGAVPKTTSGKLQRARCAALLAEGRPIGGQPPLFEARWAPPEPDLDADDTFVTALAAARGQTGEARASAVRAASIAWLVSGVERAGAAVEHPLLPDGAALDDATLAELGLDSLRTVAFFDAVERGLGVSGPRLTLYGLETFGALMAWLADPSSDAAARAPLTARSPTEPVPATAFQRLIFHDHGAAPGALMLLEVEGPATEAAVRRALAALLTRHDLLRAGFEELDGRLMIVPRPAPSGAAGVPLAAVVDPDAPNGALLATLRRPLDVARERLIRVVFAPGEPSRLGLALHHLAYDGVALNALLEEFIEALAACAAGERPTHAPTPSFLALAAEHAADEAGARAAEDADGADPGARWWRETLADVPWPVPVPHDITPAARSLVNAGRFDIAAADVAALTALARGHDATLNALVGLAWARAMGAALGVDTVACGHPISLRDGRTRAVCGPLVNDVILPLPADAGPLPDALRRVGRLLRDAGLHGAVPFETQRAYLPPGDGCPALYAFHDLDRMALGAGAGALRAGRPHTAGPLTLRRLPVDPLGGPRPFDYFAVAELAEGRLSCTLRVEASRVGMAFGAGVVDRWCRCLRRLADAAPSGGAAR